MVERNNIKTNHIMLAFGSLNKRYVNSLQEDIFFIWNLNWAAHPYLSGKLVNLFVDENDQGWVISYNWLQVIIGSPGTSWQLEIFLYRSQEERGWGGALSLLSMFLCLFKGRSDPPDANRISVCKFSFLCGLIFLKMKMLNSFKLRGS